ncbi:MAG: glycosyl hydrolase family 79 C-terminal domain-containing protein [Solirubrobacteraceae bacterium]
MRLPSNAVSRFVAVALVAIGAGVAACGRSEHRSTAAQVRASESYLQRGAVSIVPSADTIVVRSTPVAQAIPPGFVGLSLGYKAIELDAGSDPNALDPVFEQLIRDLAPGQRPVLRIAGGDQVWWPVPHMARPAGVNYNLTTGLLAVTRALAQTLDARLILGINFEADSTIVAGAQARALINGIGREWIDALELGNEPELYAAYPWYVLADGQGVPGRPADWSFGDLVQDFANISRALPRTVTLAGPAIGSSAWITLLGQFLAGNPRLGLVTLHRYPLKHCAANIPVTIPDLLANASSTGLAETVAHDVAISHARGVPLRIGEMGTIACEGMPGVSDSFASALWSLDALFAMARVNVDGVNMQTARNLNELFGIDRVRGRWQAAVQPVYYGLMMFAQAAPAGSRLLAISGTAGAAVNAWATRASGGSIHVVLINDSTDHTHTVTVQVPSSSDPPATLERLRAPSAHATSGVTLAGQSFGTQTDTGLLHGTPSSTMVTPVAGDYVVRLPVASAAMLTLPAG